MHIFYLLLLIILFIINVISCDSEKDTKKSIKVIKSSKISFKDQNGRTINLEKPAENIVSIVATGGSMLIAIDQSEKRLKGIHPGAKEGLINGILGNFFPNVNLISTNVSTSKAVPNIEELLKVNPDLIFYWNVYQKQKEYIDKMIKIGLNVVAFKSNIDKDMPSYWIDMIGKGIDRSDRAEKLIKWRFNILEALKKSVSKILDKDRLRTLYFSRIADSYRIGNLYPLNFLKANILNNLKKKTINVEEILKWNPEIIFLHPFKQSGKPQDFYENKLFSEVSAVKNRKIYKIPIGGYRWGSPSHEDPLSWMWMSMILYPDYFNFDLRKEIKIWYKMMYGKIPSKKQIDNILRINMNKNSKNYEHF